MNSNRNSVAEVSAATVPVLGLIAILAFFAGGYFPDATGWAIVPLALAVATIAVTGSNPLRTITPGLAFAAGALALYCGWVLLSAMWSNAPYRALTEFDRALLYLLAMLLGGCVAYTPNRLRWIARAIAAAAFVVCLTSLATRCFPDLFTVTQNTVNGRLSFPLTYWNNLGLLATIGLVLSVALASDGGEPRRVRVTASAAAPILAATLALTFSRGPIVAGLAGLLILVGLNRSAGLTTGLPATLLPSLVAFVAALQAPLLATRDPTTPAATSEGHELAIMIGAAVLAAMAIALALAPLERRVAEIRMVRASRSRLALAGLAVVVAGVVGAVVAGAPNAIGDRYEQFAEGDEVSGGQLRSRLTNFGNNGRLDPWRVALDSFAAEPILGLGAGTFQTAWQRDRDSEFDLQDAHSLYLEQLAELGLIGAALLIAALLAIYLALIRRLAGPERLISAGLLAVVSVWGLEAGIDWAWEMPAVTAWVFFVGGAVLAAPAGGGSQLRPPRRLSRTITALAGAALCVLPIQIATSQSRFEAAVNAFDAGDCRNSIEQALSSLSAFRQRPEPYALLAYCDVRLGSPELGEQVMARAVELDPHSWEYHYGLALVSAAAGSSPYPALDDARDLNPRDPLVSEAFREFDEAGKRDWDVTSTRLQLP